MSEPVIKIENLKKQYRLGTIGGGTLRADLQSWWARKRGKEDPNTMIGTDMSTVGDTFYALNGINLEVHEGEALGIIGANGAGKSTLLKLLSRVTAPTEGTIKMNGRIASMLEVGTGFHPELTGRENIYMNGAILGMTKAEIDSKIEDIIDFSECRQFIDTPVKRYSSGMYVKLAFSVAAHLDAEIMIMDEVLAVGDMKFQKKCLGKMGDEAKSGRTVLYVSHNMSTIRNLCTRCVVLKKGQMVFDGDVEEAITIYSERLDREVLYRSIDCNYLSRRDLLGRKCHISFFEFIEVDIPEYESGDDIKFRLVINNTDDCNDIIGRAVFRSMDGEVFAMTESNIIEKLSGKCALVFEFCTKNFPNGIYSMTVSLNEISEFGEYEMLDEIPELVYFRILENEIYGKYKSVWIGKYWGKVRLDPMIGKIDGGKQ